MTRLRWTMITFTTTAALALVALVACKGGGGTSSDSGDDATFRNAVPIHDSMKIDVPSTDNPGALMLGTRAELYTLTRGVSSSVNGHAGLVLATLRILVLLPPSERGEDYRAWGPTEPKGLDPLSWRMRVEKEGGDLFTFSADARGKASTDDADFLPMITGSVTPGAELFGSKGTLTLNFDNYQTAGGADPCPTGRIHLDWDASVDKRTVEVQWEDFLNTCNNKALTDVTYRYSQNPDFSGEFEFQTTDNVHLARAAKPGLESIVMKSRWQGDGTGRSDVALKGDEIAADLGTLGLEGSEVRVTQCWDETFNLTFSDSDPTEFEALLFEQMGEETACAFDTAEYPSF